MTSHEKLKEDQGVARAAYRLAILAGMASAAVFATTGYLHDLSSLTYLLGFWLLLRGRGYPSIDRMAQILSVVFLFNALLNWQSGIPGIVSVCYFAEQVMLLQWFVMDTRISLYKSLLLSFLLPMSTAAMSINFIFPVVLGPYLAAVLAFFLFSSVCGQIQIAGSDISDFKPARVFLSKPLLIALAKGTFIFLSLTLVIFYLLPRPAVLGITSGATDRRLMGFSSIFEIGSGGVTQDNPMVVMRVIPVEPVNLSFSHINRMRRILLRGFTFADYRAGMWSRERYRRVLYQTGPPQDGSWLNPSPDDGRLRVMFDIYLETTEPPVMFIPDRSFRVEAPPVPIRRYTDNSLEFFRRRGGTEVYRAVTTLDPPETLTPVAIEGRYHFSFAPYLDPGDASPEVRELAIRIAGNASSIQHAVELIDDYLAANYSYSLDEPFSADRDPLADFLFVNRRGSCEHFSSAMTIMLRFLGIPARPVTGYLMGEWNSHGGFFTVRQRHAHAWVEVFLSQYGWYSVDPTASQDAALDDHAFGADFLGYIQSQFEGFWFNYFHRFNRSIQTRGFVRLKAGLDSLSSAGASLAQSGSTLFGFLFIVLTVLITYSLSGYGFLRHGNRKSGWLPDAYKNWADQLPETRHPWETPSEFHSRLIGSGILPTTAAPLLDKLNDAVWTFTLGTANTSDDIMRLTASLKQFSKPSQSLEPVRK